MKCERGRGTVGYATSGFLQKFCLPLLCSSITLIRAEVCVRACVCVFSLRVRFVMFVVKEVGHVFVTLTSTERGEQGRAVVFVYLCRVNKGKYCIW